MVALIEEIACPVIEDSAKRIKEIVKALYEDITIAADLYTIPKIHISKDPNQEGMAAYLPSEEMIILNAVHLQNKEVEYIAYVLAHEVWHHRQLEDGETFEHYIKPSADRNGYEEQLIEQAANGFASRLFPDVFVA